MSDNILLKIHEELVAIRELLAKGAAAPAARPASQFSTPSAAQAEIPQPSELMDDPEGVLVHYGKNNGVALGKLSERSCEWYAQEQEPKLDSSGKPYPIRPQEKILKNAARQIYHRRKGTLKGGAATVAPEERPYTPPPAQPGAGAADDGEVPFAARHLDHG